MCLNFNRFVLECEKGTVWSAGAHIITAVIGSGVLTLAWALAQMGWIAGPTALLAFSVITMFTSTLLADCYRAADGTRNYVYKDAVKSYLGKIKIQCTQTHASFHILINKLMQEASNISFARWFNTAILSV